MTRRPDSSAPRISALVLGLLLALALPIGPAPAQLSPQAKLESLQDQLFEFLQASDYAGVLAVVREIRSLEVPVPESVLYAEGLSLLAVGRAQEAEWLLANHLERAGPGSRYYREIQELHETAMAAAGKAPAAAAAPPQAPAPGPETPAPEAAQPAPATPDETPATAEAPGEWAADDRADDDRAGGAQAGLAQRPSGPLPPSIATEWELENNPDARAWTRIRYTEDLRVFEDFVERYPLSRFVPVAEQRLVYLSKALGRRGYESFRERDYAAARESWETAARHGNDYAQTMLGFLHDQGLGVPEDSGEAARWFEMAAEQGNVTAQTNLGVLYYEGRGVAQDSQRALAWLLRGAEAGDATAQLRVGTVYQHGRGNVPQNLTEAKRWFRLSADQGNSEAATQLRILSNL